MIDRLRGRCVRGGLEGFEQVDHAVRRQVLVVVVVDLDHGRVDAGAEAFHFGECEDVVWCGVARRDSQV